MDSTTSWNCIEMERRVIAGLLWVFVLSVARVSHVSCELEEEVLKRLDILEKRQSESGAEIIRLEKVNMEQLATIQELRAETLAQKQTLAKHTEEQLATTQELRAEIVAQKQTIAKLTERVRRTEVKRFHDSHESAVQDKNAPEKQNTTASTSRMDARDQGPEIKRQTYHERQAFTAYSDTVQHPSKGDVIKFNEVLTNEGSGYSTTSGIFTCNQDGLYLFTFSVSEVNANNYVWAELVVNGQRKMEAVAETYHSHQDSQGSNLGVLRLGVGDQVWVSTKSANVIPGDDNHRVNTFTGLFLYN